MRRCLPTRVIVIALLIGAVVGSVPAVASAQTTLQQEITQSVVAQGYWDDALLLDDGAMGDVIVRFGDNFASPTPIRAMRSNRTPIEALRDSWRCPHWSSWSRVADRKRSCLLPMTTPLGRAMSFLSRTSFRHYRTSTAAIPKSPLPRPRR